MSRTFTKLFSSITESTIWCEPDRTRLVWICMLAMADQHGRVWASVPGLANRARVPVEDAQTALDAFLSPDPYSRTPDHGGRRIEPIDGGWRLLNHEKYRSIRDEETIKESKRNYINARRAKEREGVEKSRTLSNSVDRGRANAEADTDAEANNSVAKATGGPAAVTATKITDPGEIIFGYGLGMLTSAGSTDKAARSFLGGLRKMHGDEALVNSLRECARAKPLQPLEWLAAALPPPSAGRKAAGPNKQEALEQRNRSIGEAWASKED